MSVCVAAHAPADPCGVLQRNVGFRTRYNDVFIEACTVARTVYSLASPWSNQTLQTRVSKPAW